MIRVMVVDDSPLVRKIAGDILNAKADIRVVATAATAEFALSKLHRERPDVITMDMEMPGMGGLEAIREIMKLRPTPIIVLSAHARRGAELTLQALEAGAVEFVLKPISSLSGGLDAVGRELVEKVRSASSIEMKGVGETQKFGTPREAEELRDIEKPETLAALAPLQAWRETRLGSRKPLPGSDRVYELVAIGTSTGGPVALKTVLSGLPGDFPVPLVAVQHMPPVFTRAFAERLNCCCELAVKEAEEGDGIGPGRVLIAPGDYHLTVSRFHSEPRVLLNQREPVSGHRPSVDVLMHSVAREYGRLAIGVIMTGMGRDGADGIRELHGRGGYILAQDRESSVIYGMNREVIMNGDADEVVPLEQLSAGLMAQVCVRAYE